MNCEFIFVGGGGRDFMEHFLFWQELLCSYVALIFLEKYKRILNLHQSEFWTFVTLICEL